MEDKGKPFVILLVAVVVLAIFSFVGWEEVSGGLFKSYDLLADIRDGEKPGGNTAANTYLDPDLAMLDDEDNYEFLDEDLRSDTSAVTGMVAEDGLNIEERGDDLPGILDNGEPLIADAAQDYANVAGDTVRHVAVVSKGITDYSGGENVSRLKKSLSRSGNEVVRIAVIGDSYIEGDIFTEGMREALQDRYGGEGIGYTPIFSEIPGFRRSVVHNCTGFETLDFRHKSQNRYCLLHGISSRAGEEASATFSGTDKIRHGEEWSRTRLLVKAPQGGSIRVRSGKDKAQPWETYRFEAGDSLHVVEIDGTTSRISVGAITPGIIFEGVYLDGDHGIALDNMSIRGYSGIRHDELNTDGIRESREYIDYDLIILEFGTNAVSSAQNDYTAYEKKMIKVVEKLKSQYPDAVVMILGIGDRGEKRGGEIHSMTTLEAMTRAQRNIAKATGSLYWDTRAAMGGDDAVVDWVKNKDINKDYIHLSFTGGKRLAKLFMDDFDKLME